MGEVLLEGAATKADDAQLDDIIIYCNKNDITD